jgi:hypothetical protein
MAPRVRVGFSIVKSRKGPLSSNGGSAESRMGAAPHTAEMNRHSFKPKVRLSWMYWLHEEWVFAISHLERFFLRMISKTAKGDS